MILLKIILITGFALILFQDIKERQVYWFLFPLVALISGILFYNSTILELFIINVLVNLAMVVFLLTIVYSYSIFKLKTSPKNVFGLGDALLFIGLAFSFASISYIVIFVFSLIFSLLLHLLLKQKNKVTTIPLAGYMSLFFILVYVSNWTGITTNLYSI
ncbi:hypothetical protein BTO05_00555 [Winogradskyella sp. PC-19]|uniref:hypothetical protein n=1 Tax=Winogradskyella sp. PC-19 TaxID=754417 RepID=UPI000B3CE4DE|nr:hypothetical protein [Winogradskyella sp. PC-19]ARV08201.1 hypothetical protein BTO05_00555 [Winogradskyella sp. PC-19]